MKKKTNDDLTFLNNYDDQYHEILTNIKLNESSDSETTNTLNFIVINNKNKYPKNNIPKK